MTERSEVKVRPSPFSADQEKLLRSWTTHYPYPIMGLLEALRQVQQWFLCVRPDHELYLAELFKTSRAHVHEVATFFPFFTPKPAGRRRLGVCRGISCSLAGADEALARTEASLGAKDGEASADGAWSCEPMECLGACDHAPALLVDEVLAGRADEKTLGRVLAGESPEPGPDHWAPSEGAVLTRHFGEPKLHELATYRRLGGYQALEKARKLAPADLIAEVKKSNLRGLGGAGFPTGGKWETVPPVEKAPERFVVCNYDESEPGCFKDRVLGTRNPHQLLEGLLIACRAVSAQWGFVFIRGEYASQFKVFEAALREAEAAGLTGEVKVRVMRGAGAYICGLDTALLETMEGKKAWPRQPPPFPTVAGLMGKPTVVNNVETLSMLPHIVAQGGEWFAKLGVAKSGGTAVYSVSGDVERPGVYEFPMGAPLRKIIEAAGGVKGGRKLKAVIPGGASTPPLNAAELDTPMDFDALRAVGSFLGAGGVIVLDETRDMAVVAHNIERFLAHESCGQCTPCREGSEWTTRILERMLHGKGVPADLPNLQRIGENITGKVICALGDTVGMVTRGFMKKFPEDFKGKAQ